MRRNPQIRRGEWDSNPRVLANMGLAIPRPTRLGDPRPNCRFMWRQYIDIDWYLDKWQEDSSIHWPYHILRNHIKKVIKRRSLVILALNIKESNEIFRLAIIRNYFEPELLKMDYRRSLIKHPLSKENGLNVEDLLLLYFDISTGNDYPDGDEWFTI